VILADFFLFGFALFQIRIQYNPINLSARRRLVVSFMPKETDRSLVDSRASFYLLVKRYIPTLSKNQNLGNHSIANHFSDGHIPTTERPVIDP
jgi:hypothetical protein